MATNQKQLVNTEHKKKAVTIQQAQRVPTQKTKINKEGKLFFLNA
jgi:hypothetical protein